MSMVSFQPPRCVSCHQIFNAPFQVCPACGAQQAQLYPPPMVGYPLQPPKSVGVAILLSLLWLGAGHLYLGKIVSGLLLGFADLFLVIIALTGYGLIVAVPVWVISVPLVVLWAALATQSVNASQPVMLR